MIIIIILSVLTFSFIFGLSCLVGYSAWIAWIEFEIEIDLGDEDWIN